MQSALRTIWRKLLWLILVANSLPALGAASALATVPHAVRAAGDCPFRLSVINDEISPDFDHACSVAANDFGLQWIEIAQHVGQERD